MKLTEKDSLDYGIEYPADSGRLHYDFEMRLATVEDNIAAYEHPTILGGGVSNMRVNVAIYANCLLSLGSIPADEITPELLGSLVATDYDKLSEAQDRLKKKLKPSKPGSSTSGSPPSCSASTDSAKNASAS